MPQLIRAASLRGYDSLVDELGGDGNALLLQNGIDPADVDSDDAFVVADARNRALEGAADQLGRLDFGLLLGERQDHSILGPLAMAIAAAPTAGDQVKDAGRFLYTHGADLSLEIEPDPLGQRGVAGICFRNAFVDSVYSPQAVELGVSLMHRIATLAWADGYPLLSVMLPHAPVSPAERYREFFGVDVQFDCTDAVLRLPRVFLETPVPQGDKTLHKLAVAHLAEAYPDPSRGLTAHVRQALAESISSTGHTVEAIAGLLLMHPRTLQRRLAAEGATFEGIVNDVRRRLALKIIVETDLPLRKVAELCGMAEQATLTRAVRRWFGVTPTVLRRSGVRSVSADAADTDREF